MRHTSTAASFAVTLLLGTAAGAAPVNLLLNGGAEEGKKDRPSAWDAASVPAPELKMSRDTETFRSGKASLSISNGHRYEQPTSNNWRQSLQSIPLGKTVVVSGWIKTADAGAANICVQCWDAGGDGMLGFASTPVVRGDKDWTELKSDPLVVPSMTKSMVVRAALTGLGKAWFDDVLVSEVAAGGANVKQPVPLAAPVKPASLDKALLEKVGGEVVEVQSISQDQMIVSYLPEWAHGRVDNIGVETNDMGGARTLFAWPKPKAKPEGHRFVLACYARERSAPAGDAKPGKIGAYEVLATWDEQTPWTKQPKTADKPAAEFDVAAGEGWVTFDVTPLVRKQLAGGADAAHGLMLRFVKDDSNPERAGYAFVSREGEGEWQSRRPLLLVVKE